MFFLNGLINLFNTKKEKRNKKPIVKDIRNNHIEKVLTKEQEDQLFFNLIDQAVKGIRTLDYYSFNVKLAGASKDNRITHIRKFIEDWHKDKHGCGLLVIREKTIPMIQMLLLYTLVFIK